MRLFALLLLLFAASVFADYASNVQVIEEVETPAVAPEVSDALDVMVGQLGQAVENSSSVEIQEEIPPGPVAEESVVVSDVEINDSFSADINPGPVEESNIAENDSEINDTLSTPVNEEIPSLVVEQEGLTVIEQVDSPPVAPIVEDALDVLVGQLGEKQSEESNNNETQEHSLPEIIDAANETIQNITVEQTIEIKNSKGEHVKAKISTKNRSLIIEPEKAPIRKIEFHNLDDQSSTLRIDDVQETGAYSKFKEVYAIDPSALNFTDATVTAVAKGTRLYKCKEWDFDQQTCNGEWVKLMDITPGQEYTFTLTADDPGFAESITICEAESLAPFNSWAGACDGTYPAACGAAGDLVGCNDGLTETHSSSSGNQFAGVRITQHNTSITDCNSIQSVQLCIEWWGDSGLAPINCTISVDDTNGTNATAVNTTCPGTSANPGVTCQNVTNSKNWTCSNFFGATGTAQASAQLQRSVGGTKLVSFDVLLFNVTYSAGATNASTPANQTVELGAETSINWTLTGTGGEYRVLRNGTLFQGPASWTSGTPIVIVPNTFFLGIWNYTLLFNDTAGANSTSSTFVEVVDTILPSCSEVTGSTGSITKANVTINGDVSEWDNILLNPNNFQTDLTLLQGDPDVPPTADRDMTRFAYTYDDTYLYFYFGRLAFGRNQVSMIVYIDYGIDGFMNSSDRVAKFVWSGSTRQYDTDFYNYNPANVSDALVGDGVNMPGSISVNTSVESNLVGGTVAGTELETRIPWSTLGLSGPTALSFKAAVARGSGTNLPDQLTDNIGNVTTAQSTFLLFRPDQSKTARNGTSVYYAHDLMNCGNIQQKIQLTNTTTQGWNITLFHPFANETVISDTDANGQPDVTLGTENFTTLIVRIDIPASETVGTVDVTNITANPLTNNKTVTDTTTISAISITPNNHSVSAAQGALVSLDYTVSNFQPFEDTIEINATSSNNFTITLYFANGTLINDTDSDGSIDLGSMVFSESEPITARIQIPPNATIGTTDVITIIITSSVNSNTTSNVTSNITVRERLNLTPENYSRTVTAGSREYYEFNLTNNWNESDVIDLSFTSTQGWNITLVDVNRSALTDTDNDSVVDIGSLGPYGSQITFFVKVEVPNNVTTGASEIITLYANSSLNTSIFETAIINSTPRGIELYNDSNRTVLQQTFKIEDTVFATAFFLQGISEVYFVWFDGVNYTRTSPNISVNVNGTANDEIETNITQSLGTWTVFLIDSSDDSEVSRRTFEVLDTEFPNITLVHPPENSTFNTSQTIALSVNVTDNYAVEAVTANVTFPNGTTQLINLTNVSITYSTNFTIPNLTGQYNVTFTANDTSGNTNTTTTFFIVQDVEPPLVFDLVPVANTSFNPNMTIEIEANVTDNIAVDKVFANITFPNGTTQIINLTNTIGNKYSANFTIPNLVGIFNVTFIANDTSNNINNSESTFFVTTTEMLLFVTIVQPLPNTIFNQTQNVTILANLTKNATVTANITQPNGTTQEINLTFNGTQWFFTNNYTNTTQPGTYNITVTATDGENISTDTTNFTINDVTPPNITIVEPLPGTNFSINQTVIIKVNATDPFFDQPLNVTANITLPNGTIETINLTFNATSQLYEGPFTNTEQITLYNVTAIAIDDSGNTNTDTTNFNVLDESLPNVFDLKPANTTHIIDTTIEIAANVTDNIAVDKVFANITFPNGTTQLIELMNAIGDKYNASFTIPNLTGTYNITFIANDTSNNINNTETTSFTAVITDTAPPQWSNNITNPPSPATYAIQDYQFNITWIDDFAVDTVIIEHNFTGVLQNESMSNVGSIYFFNQSNLSAGTYVWRSYANDTSGNENQSDQFQYVVNKANTTLNLTANPGFTVVSGTQTNISCSADNDEVNITLYRNGTEIGSSIGGTVSDVQTLPPGIYTYSCNATGGQNFAGVNITNTLTVLNATPPTASAGAGGGGGGGNRYYVPILPVCVNGSSVLIGGKSYTTCCSDDYCKTLGDKWSCVQREGFNVCELPQFYTPPVEKSEEVKPETASQSSKVAELQKPAEFKKPPERESVFGRLYNSLVSLPKLVVKKIFGTIIIAFSRINFTWLLVVLSILAIGALIVIGGALPAKRMRVAQKRKGGPEEI